mmetsp:Transcript_8587/g.13622  ORF Transcript_8587/g.13622 Transcript_8587/m.13622 type:complete len:245 (-) Transcript_8587:314-1048(-)
MESKSGGSRSWWRQSLLLRSAPLPTSLSLDKPHSLRPRERPRPVLSANCLGCKQSRSNECPGPMRLKATCLCHILQRPFVRRPKGPRAGKPSRNQPCTMHGTPLYSPILSRNLSGIAHRSARRRERWRESPWRRSPLRESPWRESPWRKSPLRKSQQRRSPRRKKRCPRRWRVRCRIRVTARRGATFSRGFRRSRVSRARRREGKPLPLCRRRAARRSLPLSLQWRHLKRPRRRLSSNVRRTPP